MLCKHYGNKFTVTFHVLANNEEIRFFKPSAKLITKFQQRSQNLSNNNHLLIKNTTHQT